MSVRKIAAAFALAAPMLTMGSAAIAAPMLYSFSGIVSGTLGGTPFSNARLTASGVGDTSAIQEVEPGVYCNDLASLSITIEGLGRFTVSGPANVASATTDQLLGLGTGACASTTHGWFIIDSPAAASYHLDTPIGPVTGTEDNYSDIETSGGTLALDSPPTTFTAQFAGGPAAVPALDGPSLGLLALLLAAAGAFTPRARSRRRQSHPT